MLSSPEVAPTRRRAERLDEPATSYYVTETVQNYLLQLESCRGRCADRCLVGRVTVVPAHGYYALVSAER